MGLVLRRHLGRTATMERQSYCVMPVPQSSPGSRAIRVGNAILTVRMFIRCPDCDALGSLDDTYKIGRDGSVTPRWSCSTETCPCSDFLVLDSLGDEHKISPEQPKELTMTSQDFARWLQGFAELTGDTVPTTEQWRSIREHLQLVFAKVTSPVVVQTPALAARLNAVQRTTAIC